MELLKEEQELTDGLKKGTEVKKKFVSILKGLKSRQKVTNGFYHCPECLFKTNWHRMALKRHINAVHRKFKPWECSDCSKGKRIKTYH